MLGLVLMVALSALATGSAASPVAAQEATDCDRGWFDVELREDIAPEEVVALAEDEIWVAGGAMLGGGRRQAVTLHGDADSWDLQVPPGPDERDTGFMGIAAAGPGQDVWAVGYAREVDYVSAMTAVRREGGWHLTDVMRPGGEGATLVDVDAAPGAGVWAAGFIQGPPGDQRAWMLERVNDGWEASQPPLGDGERATLAGLSVSDEGGVWGAGTVLKGPGMRPYLVQRIDDGWLRHDVPGLEGAALADIDVPAVDDGWAVGHRLSGETIAPLILHWDGNAWLEAGGPDVGSEATLLTSVARAEGVLTVGGTTWHPGKGRYVGWVARDDGSGWTVTVSRPGWGMGTVTDIDGDPGTSGWVVGRMDEGLIGRVCASPSAPLATEEIKPATPTGVTPPREATSPSAIAGAVVALDVTKAAGLPTESQSWGSVAADFDGDGLDDIFLGRHGARAALYLNAGGRFEDSERKFGGGDRHGCVAGDVDGSGLPDLYCSFGASRGTGTKANQLWLDPGGATPQEHPRAGGATEPLGRGRQARLLDIDEDGHADLLLGQETKRMDGQPSTNRAFLRTGPARFEAAEIPGFDTGLATESLDIADYDGDGRVDVLLVYYDKRAGEPKAGIRLYRNEEGPAFTDVTAEAGIATIDERDAELRDMDGDGRPDLVQLSEERVLVSALRDGRFEPIFERHVDSAAALATGDADGDGDRDIYVLQGKSDEGAHDLILLNDGDGASFVELAVPEVKGGSEDDVVALDYDGDGRTDFLATNGRNSARGPVQLITLGPA